MQLRDLLHREISRANCERIIRWVGNNETRFRELVQFVFNKDRNIAQFASWPLSDIVIKKPGFVRPYLSSFIKKLDEPGLHPAITRHITRLLQFIEIPKRFQGIVMDQCFRFLTSTTEKPAVKANALTILGTLAQQYPEFSSELKAVIHDRYTLETPAFKARARMVLSKLN